MAISFIAAASANATSVALPVGWQVGDLAIAIARRTSSSFPGTNAAWTNFLSGQGGTGDSVRLYYRILQSGDTTVGSFSSAGSVGVLIYRGASGVGASDFIGNSTGSTINYPALTLNNASGSSWVLVLGSHRSATNVNAIAPTGAATNRTSGWTATAIGAADTNGGVTSWSATSSTVNASQSNSGYSVELLAAGAAPVELQASSDLTFSQTPILRVQKALAGVFSLDLGSSTSLQVIRALAGSSGLTFGSSATLDNQIRLAGSSGLIFGSGGDLIASALLAGTSDLGFGSSAILRAGKPLAGSSAIDFSATPVLLAAKRLAASVSLTLDVIGSMTSAVTLAGSSGLTFGESASLRVVRGLAGSSGLTFSPAASLRVGGQIDGSALLSLTPTASLRVGKPLAGSGAAEFGAGGLLDSASLEFPGRASWQYRRLLPSVERLLQVHQLPPQPVSLAGDASLTFNHSAQLAQQETLLTASSDLTFSQTAILKDVKTLAATAAVHFDTAGALADPTAVQATVQRVQTIQQNSGLDPMPFALPQTTQAGRFLVLFVSMRTGSGSNVASISDDGGNSWTRRATGVYGAANTHIEVWTSPGTFAATTLTLDLPALRDTTISLVEVSGIDADNPFIEAVGSNVGVAATTIPVSAVTLPESGIALAAVNTGTGNLATAVSNGYTLIANVGQTSNRPALTAAAKTISGAGVSATDFTYGVAVTAGTVAIGLRAAESLSAVELAGSGNLTFAPVGDLASENTLEAEVSLSFDTGASLEAGLTGQTGIDFEPVVDLGHEVPLAGSAQLTFGSQATLMPPRPVEWRLTTFRHGQIFEDPALRLASEQKVVQTGALSGVSAIEFAASGAVAHSVPLAAGSGLSFEPTATLSGGSSVSWRLTTFRHSQIFDDPALRLIAEMEPVDSGALSGTSSLVFNATAGAATVVELSGNTQIDFSHRADLREGVKVLWRLLSLRHNQLFEDPALRLEAETVQAFDPGWLQAGTGLVFSSFAELVAPTVLAGSSSLDFGAVLNTSSIHLKGQSGVEFTVSGELSEAIALAAQTGFEFTSQAKLYEGPPKDWNRDEPPPDAFLPRRRRDSFNRPLRDCERLGVPKVVLTSMLDGTTRGTYICEEYSLNQQLNTVLAFSLAFTQSQSKHLLDLKDYLKADLYVGDRLLATGPVDNINFDRGLYKLDCSGEMAELTKIRAKSNAKYTDEPVIGILYDLLSRAPGWEIGEIHTMPDILVTTTVDLREEKRLFAQIVKLLEQIPGLYLRYAGNKTIDIGLFDERIYPPLQERDTVGPLKHTVRYAEVIHQIEAFGGQWTRDVYSPFVEGQEQTLLRTDTFVIKLQRALELDPTLATHPEYPIVLDSGSYVVRNLKVPASIGAEMTEFYREIVPQPSENPEDSQVRDAAIALWQRCVAELKKRETMEDDWSMTTHRIPCEILPGDRVFVSGKYQQLYYDPLTGEASVAYLDEVSQWFRVIQIDEQYQDGQRTWTLNLTPNQALPNSTLQSLQLFDTIAEKTASKVVTKDENDPYDSTAIDETYVLYTISIGPDAPANAWIGDSALFYPAREEIYAAAVPAGYSDVEIVKLFTTDPFDDAQIVDAQPGSIKLRVADNQDWDLASTTTAYVLARYS